MRPCWQRLGLYYKELVWGGGLGNFQSEDASNLFEKMEIRRLDVNLEEQGGRRRMFWMCTSDEEQ